MASFVHAEMRRHGVALRLDETVTGFQQNGDSVLTLLESSEPVSYTHLDVYKRQVQRRLWSCQNRAGVGGGVRLRRERFALVHGSFVV